jgi:hypothetical protein
MNLHADQFRNTDKKGADEFIHRLVHLSSDSIDTDELTNISVHLMQSSRSRLIGNEFVDISVHFRVEKNELINISVQS